MRRKQHRTADAATAREARQTYEPNQWRELVKVALLATAFIGAYATGAALSPVVEPAPAAAPPPPPPPPPPPEILPCAQHTFITIVLPSVVNPPKRPQRLRAIAETWGPKARAVFVTTKPSSYPPLPYPAPCEGYPFSLEVPSSIGEELGVERLRWVLSQTLVAKVSYVFMANDHTAVIPENLACFLKSVDPSKPAYAGRALAQKRGKSIEIFNSGAAGYVITRPTLELVERHWGTAPCDAKKSEKWLQGNPGLVLARCLQRHGVRPVDTQHEEEGHRFHAYGPVRIATKALDDWYVRMNSQLPWPSYDGCATDAISFHYVESAEQHAIYDSVRGDLDEVMEERWPKAPSDLGGYSRHWRNDVQRNEVRDLLSAIKLATPDSCTSTPSR